MRFQQLYRKLYAGYMARRILSNMQKRLVSILFVGGYTYMEPLHGAVNLG